MNPKKSGSILFGLILSGLMSLLVGHRDIPRHRSRNELHGHVDQRLADRLDGRISRGARGGAVRTPVVELVIDRRGRV